MADLSERGTEEVLVATDRFFRCQSQAAADEMDQVTNARDYKTTNLLLPVW